MKKFHQLPRRNQKGFSLLELMLSIAVGLVLIGVGLFVYRQVNSDSSAYNASNGMLMLSSGIKTMYTTPNYAGITPAGVINAGKAPQSMVNGATLVGRWGGTIAVDPANYGGGANNAFRVIYPNVPRSECNTIISSIEPNFDRIEVSATAGATTGDLVKDRITSVVLNPTTLATECNNENNVLIVTAT